MLMSEQKKEHEEKSKVNRRRFLAYAAGGVVVVGAAAAGAYYLTAPGPTPTSTATTSAPPTSALTTAAGTTAAAKGRLRFIAGSWDGSWDQPNKKFTEDTGIGLDVEVPPVIPLTTRIIGAGAGGFDIATGFSAVGKPLLMADPPIIQPTDVSRLPMWTQENVDPIWSEPEKYVTDEVILGKMKFYLWGDPYREETPKLNGLKRGQVYALWPDIYNWDGIAYNPDFLPYEEKGSQVSFSYGEMYNPEWKGRVAYQPTFITNFCWTAAYLAKSGQWEGPRRKDFYDLEPDEIDKMVDFMIPYVKNGQIRAFASEMGEHVTLLASKEVWITQAWQPVLMEVRRAGTPCYYANAKEGLEWWYNGQSASATLSGQKLDDAYTYQNWRISPWFTDNIAGLGYNTPTYVSDQFKKYIGDEKWGWMYGGNATYKPITEIVPGEPERRANAMFVPEKYTWSKEPGTPDPKGNLRDLGPIPDREKRMMMFDTWFEYADYAVEAWSKVKAAKPA